MMDIESLRIFVEVARLHSFSAAARSLQLPSSNVSARVQKLESQLQVRLFHRSTRHIRLTEVGQGMYEKSLEILALRQNMQALAEGQEGEAKGVLKITAPSSLSRQYLGDWLIEFKQLYPAVQLELLSSNQSLDFYEYRLDFAFRQGPLPDSNQHAQKLVDIYFGLYVSPDLVASHSCDSLEQLEGMPCIFGGALGRLRPWSLFDYNHNKAVRFQTQANMLLDDAELIYRAALAGHGVAYLARTMVADDVKAGRLQPLLEKYWPGPSTMYLVYQEKKSLSVKHQCFIDFIQSKCQQMLSRRG